MYRAPIWADLHGPYNQKPCWMKLLVSDPNRSMDSAVQSACLLNMSGVTSDEVCNKNTRRCDQKGCSLCGMCLNAQVSVNIQHGQGAYVYIVGLIIELGWNIADSYLDCFPSFFPTVFHLWQTFICLHSLQLYSPYCVYMGDHIKQTYYFNKRQTNGK